MATRRYTDEQLREAVDASVSYAQVLRLLGIRQAGGSQSYIKDRITRLSLDTSHFTGQGHNKGKRSPKRKTANEILVDRSGTNGRRAKAVLLRRALEEYGVEYRCSSCKLVEWQGRPITLQVDHIDGNWLNDTESNLRYLCPNCHSQTANYGNMGR